MQPIDWTKSYDTYKGRWVALSDADNETAVGSGASAGEALSQAQSKGHTNAALTYVPHELVTFAGLVYEVPVHHTPSRRKRPILKITVGHGD